MKDRKKLLRFFLLPWPWRAFFLSTLLLLFIFSGFTFSTIRLVFGEGFRPKLVPLWPIPAVNVVGVESTALSVQETVIFPDQVMVFLKYPPSAAPFTEADISCIYYSISSPNSSEPQSQTELPPESAVDEYLGRRIVRCPLPQPGFVAVSLAVKRRNGRLLPVPAGPTYQWDSLAYEALIDRDNTTVVFVKGLNLRSGRASDPTKFRCVYGWDFSNPKFMLHSDVVSIAQEIVRCQTPASVLNSPDRIGFRNNPIKVSVRRIGTRTPMKSIARPEQRLVLPSPTRARNRKQHQMCICTMLRNQARFLPEWVIYHTWLGVERWFIYDNNSFDDIKDVIKALVDADYKISLHIWPWIKTQEAGFAHCALRARDYCEWVGFMDVDEFLHLPINNSSGGLTTLIKDIVRNETVSNSNNEEVGELRVSCLNFGPSGHNRIPVEGVMVGYTCRMIFPERHKSIVRPEALNDSLVNIVHHFELKAGFRAAGVGRDILVINHYKYQVWEVFKHKFYRRVATYVSDWQRDQNVGSKDRTPGLGTKAVEPPDWATRFCQVNDTALRDRLLHHFADPITRMLPWQHYH